MIENVMHLLHYSGTTLLLNGRNALMFWICNVLTQIIMIGHENIDLLKDQMLPV